MIVHDAITLEGFIIVELLASIQESLEEGWDFGDGGSKSFFEIKYGGLVVVDGRGVKGVSEGGEIPETGDDEGNGCRFCGLDRWVRVLLVEISGKTYRLRESDGVLLISVYLDLQSQS